jgi:ketosteroid isomerase-like protein
MNAKGIVKSWFDAIEARDAQRVLDALADDVEIGVEAMDRPIVGKDALRALMANSMGAYEFLRIEPQKILESGNEVAVLARGRAKLRSDVEVLGEKLPTAGKELSVTAALFVT